jgi:hypothetical protein
MSVKYYFPTEQELKKVDQKNRSHKIVFARSLYARRIDRNGKQKASAWAVASEPEILWCGENVRAIIKEIQVIAELRTLTVPIDIKLNGLL